MKMNCGPTEEEQRRSAREYWCEWQQWFAWYPVRVGSGDCRWLEYVERKAEGVTGAGLFYKYTPFGFRYRAITN